MKTVVITLVAGVVWVLVFVAGNMPAYSNPTGAPAGAAGAPNDGGIPAGTCAKSTCHDDGTPIAQAGMITSDIPVTGYVPGQTYTITATVSAANKVKFGFQVSPQNNAGNTLGTLVVTNANETHLVGAGKYITHKNLSNTGAGSRSWAFDWVAPVAGTGTVNFYGSLMVCNNDSTNTGDQVYTSVLTAQEDISGVGINDITGERTVISVFSNPGNGSFKLLLDNLKSNACIKIFDIGGNLIFNSIYQNNGQKTQQVDVGCYSAVNAGLYVLLVETAAGIEVRKLVVL